MKLLFVYNAFSGAHNRFLDGLHKLVDPEGYSCNLCRLTHGAFAEKRVWKQFRRESGMNMDFLHLDEFQKRYASKFGYRFTFPIILMENKQELEVFISTSKLEEINSTGELIDLLNERRSLFFNNGKDSKHQG